MSGVSGHALRARPEPLRRCGAKKPQKDLSVRTCHILKSGFFAPSRLPVCIVAQFMHGGEADSRAIVQSTTHDYNEKPMALSILLCTEGIPTIRSFRGSSSSES